MGCGPSSVTTPIFIRIHNERGEYLERVKVHAKMTILEAKKRRAAEAELILGRCAGGFVKQEWMYNKRILSDDSTCLEIFKVDPNETEECNPLSPVGVDMTVTTRYDVTERLLLGIEDTLAVPPTPTPILTNTH